MLTSYFKGALVTRVYSLLKKRKITDYWYYKFLALVLNLCKMVYHAKKKICWFVRKPEKGLYITE